MFKELLTYQHGMSDFISSRSFNGKKIQVLLIRGFLQVYFCKQFKGHALKSNLRSYNGSISSEDEKGSKDTNNMKVSSEFVKTYHISKFASCILP